MAEDSHLERTEPASQRRLEEAREEGNVARSPELSAFAVLVSALGAVWFAGAGAMEGLKRLTAHGLTLDGAAVRDPAAMGGRLYDFALDALTIGAPLFAVTVVAALVTPLAVSGWSFAPSALLPKFSRISPVAGFGRMFSTRGLTELTKAILKATLIGGVACLVLWQARGRLLDLAGQPVDTALAALGELVVVSVFSVAAVMVLIVAFDIPVQLWQYAKNLRMSREDVKREHKDSEGDPHVKAAIRTQQREAARKRMMAEVPKADVVVTNPTHFAVALRYDESMRAPTVVAKGADLLAARIRGIAEANNVPILEAAPLARALYTHTDLGDAVPEKLYTAVAEVLAYVFQLRSHGASGLRPLGEIEVPAELDPLAATI
jgi:flagellar biosynthesis protein FlhB